MDDRNEISDDAVSEQQLFSLLASLPADPFCHLTQLLTVEDLFKIRGLSRVVRDALSSCVLMISGSQETNQTIAHRIQEAGVGNFRILGLHNLPEQVLIEEALQDLRECRCLEVLDIRGCPGIFTGVFQQDQTMEQERAEAWRERVCALLPPRQIGQHLDIRIHRDCFPPFIDDLGFMRRSSTRLPIRNIDEAAWLRHRRPAEQPADDPDNDDEEEDSSALPSLLIINMDDSSDDEDDSMPSLEPAREPPRMPISSFSNILRFCIGGNCSFPFIVRPDPLTFHGLRMRDPPLVMEIPEDFVNAVRDVDLEAAAAVEDDNDSVDVS